MLSIPPIRLTAPSPDFLLYFIIMDVSRVYLVTCDSVLLEALLESMA